MTQPSDLAEAPEIRTICGDLDACRAHRSPDRARRFDALLRIKVRLVRRYFQTIEPRSRSNRRRLPNGAIQGRNGTEGKLHRLQMNTDAHRWPGVRNGCILPSVSIVVHL